MGGMSDPECSFCKYLKGNVDGVGWVCRLHNKIILKEKYLRKIVCNRWIPKDGIFHHGATPYQISQSRNEWDNFLKGLDCDLLYFGGETNYAIPFERKIEIRTLESC